MHIRTIHSGGYKVCAMYRFVVFLALALVVSADIPDEIKECIEPMKYPMQCCKTLKRKEPLHDDSLKECMDIPHEAGSCERYTCIATKKGFLSSDGTINMDVLQKDLEKTLSENKDLLAAIKMKCIDGDYEKYGEPEVCPMRKMGNCMLWQFMWGCPDFSDEGQCKGISDVAKKCMKLDP